MSISQAISPVGQELPVPDSMERVRQLLAAKPDGVIEAIAREIGVSTLAVLEQLRPNSGLDCGRTLRGAVAGHSSGLGRGPLHRAHARYRAGMRRRAAASAPSAMATIISMATARSAGISRPELQGDLSGRPAVPRAPLLFGPVLQRRRRGDVQGLRAARCPAGPAAGSARAFREPQDEFRLTGQSAARFVEICFPMLKQTIDRRSCVRTGARRSRDCGGDRPPSWAAPSLRGNQSCLCRP